MKAARVSVWAAAAALGAAVATYLAAGYAIYRRLADVRGSCDEHMGNHPDDFVAHREWPIDFDITPYRMPHYQRVRLPSRQNGITLAGWWVQHPADAAPAVILLDGMGGCKASVAVLAPAGMLYRNGCSVLLIDLRDTGESDADDGYSAIGNDECLDVLGAWDWLVEQQGIAASRIGVFANSLGGAAALYAFSEEPRIAALCLQSTFGNLTEVLRAELRRNGYPAFLARGAFLVGRWLSGVNLAARDPIGAIRRCAGRPVFIIHSRADERLDVRQSEQLARAAAAAGVQLTTWFPDRALHVQTISVHPEEFERRVVDFFRQHLAG